MPSGEPQEATEDRRQDSGQHRDSAREPMDCSPTGQVPCLSGKPLLERARTVGLLLRVGNGLHGQSGAGALIEIVLLLDCIRSCQILQGLRQPAERRVRV